MSLPIVTIIGNLKRLETKFLPSGKEMTSFQLECSEKNSKGEWQNLYIKGEVWEKSSQFVKQYFKEGSVAIVTGKLVTNVYEKQDGTKVYEIKFLFPNVSFAPKDRCEMGEQQNQGYNHSGDNMNRPSTQEMNSYTQQQNNQPQLDISDDSIPF